MSRVGLAPIPIPDGVEVSVDGGLVTTKGPKGSLAWEVPSDVSVVAEGGELRLERSDESRQARSMHGLARSLVNNMVTGVTEGFRKDLEIVGVGYRATAKGKDKLELALGFSHPVEVIAPEGITFDVPQPTEIGVIGIDKQLVGQVAADIRALRKPEPYKGKGIRYAGEHIVRKAGKAAK